MCRSLKTLYLQIKRNFTYWPYMDDTRALKAQSESSSCMSGVSRTVLGKKDIFLLCLTANGLESVPCLPFWRNWPSVLWQPVLCQLCKACRGGHSSFCLAGIASSNHEACHLHLICFGVCWWHSVQLVAVLYVSLGIRIPCCICIFHKRSNKGEVCLLLDGDWNNIKVSSNEDKGSVGFRTCVIDVCVSHIWSSVMVCPRYLACVTLASVWSYSLFYVWIGFLLPVMAMTLHLVVWNFIFHNTSQNPMVDSSCTFSASWGLAMTR